MPMTYFYTFQTQPNFSHVLCILDQFCHVSGYKLNLQKSKLFLINEAAHKYTSSSLPFKVSNKCRYLVVNVVDKFSNFFSANFSPLLKLTLNLNLSIGDTFHSLLQAVLIPSNIIPICTYLFQCIPVFIPKSFFYKLNSIISCFVLNNKAPHIAKSILQHPKCLGGMAAPDCLAYYWASIRWP